MGSSCFSELIYSRHAVKCTLYQIVCVCVNLKSYSFPQYLSSRFLNLKSFKNNQLEKDTVQ